MDHLWWKWLYLYVILILVIVYNVWIKVYYELIVSKRFTRDWAVIKSIDNCPVSILLKSTKFVVLLYPSIFGVFQKITFKRRVSLIWLKCDEWWWSNVKTKINLNGIQEFCEISQNFFVTFIEFRMRLITLIGFFCPGISGRIDA